MKSGLVDQSSRKLLSGTAKASSSLYESWLHAKGTHKPFSGQNRDLFADMLENDGNYFVIVRPGKNRKAQTEQHIPYIEDTMTHSMQEISVRNNHNTHNLLFASMQKEKQDIRADRSPSKDMATPNTESASPTLRPCRSFECLEESMESTLVTNMGEAYVDQDFVPPASPDYRDVKNGNGSSSDSEVEYAVAFPSPKEQFGHSSDLVQENKPMKGLSWEAKSAKRMLFAANPVQYFLHTLQHALEDQQIGVKATKSGMKVNVFVSAITKKVSPKTSEIIWVSASGKLISRHEQRQRYRFPSDLDKMSKISRQGRIKKPGSRLRRSSDEFLFPLGSQTMQNMDIHGSTNPNKRTNCKSQGKHSSPSGQEHRRLKLKALRQKSPDLVKPESLPSVHESAADPAQNNTSPSPKFSISRTHRSIPARDNHRTSSPVLSRRYKTAREQRE